jgi:septal ring factor EnvC (AmiA/AmiB activator)
MKIPFITEIKELKSAISEAEGEIIFLKEDINKLRIQISLIERILKEGESGKIAKHRMIKTIYNILR